MSEYSEITESRVLRCERHTVSEAARSFYEQAEKVSENGVRIETYDDKLEEVGLLGRQRSAHCLLQSVLPRERERERFDGIGNRMKINDRVTRE